MTDEIPTSKCEAAITLYNAKGYLHTSDTKNYHTRKAEQLLEALADSILCDARITAWYVDLGFVGCQGDDNSIGGVSCIMNDEAE